MEARRNLKQIYKSLVNEALDQCQKELASALEEMGNQGQLVTDQVTYDKLAAEAEEKKNSATPGLASMLLKFGMTGLDAKSNNTFKKFADAEDKSIKGATVFYSPKGLSNVWIYNKYLSRFFDKAVVKKIFNVKRFEMALLNTKAELFPYDVDEITNPHADFKDGYFHQQIDAALLDYGIRVMRSGKVSLVKTIYLQFKLDEAKKAVQATITLQSEGQPEITSFQSEVVTPAESPRAANSSSVAYTFISNPPVVGQEAVPLVSATQGLSH